MSDPPDPSAQLQLAAVIVRVENLERSEAWYRLMFNWTVNFRDPSYRLIRLAGDPAGSIALWERRPEESLQLLTRESAFLTFITHDLMQAHADLCAKGADCTPLRAEPGTQFFWASDPDCHQILVIQLLME